MNPHGGSTVIPKISKPLPRDFHELTVLNFSGRSSWRISKSSRCRAEASTSIIFASTTVTVKLETACGEDLYDLYADDIADVTAFTVANKTTGAAITVTGVTKNATLKAWVIALDSEDTDLPSSTGKYVVSAVSPSALNTLGVSGYEVTNSLEVTRP